MSDDGANAGARSLRVRGGGEARVTNEELFFDLVYAFAVTQTSHFLLTHLNGFGALEALVLWFAVWLAWQYTCWFTNWFDPETTPVRALLFATALLSLIMAAALPMAFGARGSIFALAYVAMQLARTLYSLVALRHHALAANYLRILGWNVVAACFWCAGAAVASESMRLALWAIGVASEYVAPMLGFRLPFLGRSLSRDWTIEGGHMAERCQLFVIVALGEALLSAGASFAEMEDWELPIFVALAVGFLGGVAVWRLYFGVTAKDGGRVIREADDPGRIGAFFHYTHVGIIGAIIVIAVANDLMIAHPCARMDAAACAIMVGGPAAYLVANGFYKTVVYGRFPLSHGAGLAALAVLAPLCFATDRLMTGGLTVAILLVVGAWEAWSRGGSPAATAAKTAV